MGRGTKERVILGQCVRPERKIVPEHEAVERNSYNLFRITITPENAGGVGIAFGEVALSLNAKTTALLAQALSEREVVERILDAATRREKRQDDWGHREQMMRGDLYEVARGKLVIEGDRLIRASEKDD